MKYGKYAAIGTGLLILCAIAVFPLLTAAREEEHDGHDHAAAAGHEGHDQEAGREHDDHDDDAEGKHDGHIDDAGGKHDGHKRGGDTAAVVLSAEQIREFDIETQTAGPGTIRRRITLPARIVINEDRAVHLVPRAPGIVRQVMVHIGDAVKAGQALAVLDSAELGAARIDYLAKLSELNCCSIALDRARAVHRNVRKLVALLATSPSLEELQEVAFEEVGEGHARLLSAYSEKRFAAAEYEREKRLFEQKVTSAAELNRAENAYKKAVARYVAARSGVAFSAWTDFVEARQSRREMTLKLKAARRTLHLLGLDHEEIHALDTRAADFTNTAEPCDCGNPNCKTCGAAGGTKTVSAPGDTGIDEQTLGHYTLRAPFDGMIIEKHIVRGEKLDGSTDVFTIADLSTVWVDLSVYQKDLAYIRAGQAVRIAPGKGIPPADGRIAVVFPLVDNTTRTGTARLVLPNPAGRYRPGLFADASIEAGSVDVPVTVPANAVQEIESETVVFVPAGEGFTPAIVTTGRRSGSRVEIVSGLHPGDRYVSRGAFHLKAEIVTSGLGAHAGHGH